MVYSKGQEGHLSKRGIDALRSSFSNDIFRQEQYHLFQLQTNLRQEIKEAAEEKLSKMVNEAGRMPKPPVEICALFTKLRKQLDKYQGKKVYGYLPKSIKATVNEITDVLSREPNIEKLYDEWNKINREKLSLYYENKDPSVPLAENKEFRSIKNLIIRTVLEMPVANEWTIQQSMMAAQTLIGSLARIIGDKCFAQRRALQEQIDSKLQAKIQEKKQALGLRTEHTQQPTYQTQEEYNMSR